MAIYRPLYRLAGLAGLLEALGCMLALCVLQMPAFSSITASLSVWTGFAASQYRQLFAVHMVASLLLLSAMRLRMEKASADKLRMIATGSIQTKGRDSLSSEQEALATSDKLESSSQGLQAVKDFAAKMYQRSGLVVCTVDCCDFVGCR